MKKQFIVNHYLLMKMHRLPVQGKERLSVNPQCMFNEIVHLLTQIGHINF